MGGTAKVERKKLIPFELGEDLERDLAAFCVAHYNASKVEVVRRAIRQLIENDVARNPGIREAFEEAREHAARRPAEVLQLTPKTATPDRSE